MSKSCEHLNGLTPADFPPQKTLNACKECLAEGTVWVAVRECQSGGHIGCCDSSTGKHATKHFHKTQHPVMRAVPPAAWIWCYVHETQGILSEPLNSEGSCQSTALWQAKTGFDADMRWLRPSGASARKRDVPMHPIVEVFILRPLLG